MIIFPFSVFKLVYTLNGPWPGQTIKIQKKESIIEFFVINMNISSPFILSKHNYDENSFGLKYKYCYANFSNLGFA